MALSDEVQSRISSQRLIELTNDGTPSATTVNTTILGKAADDIQGDFELLSSEDFDLTNPSHVAICVPAVMGKLYEYQGKISPLTNESYDIFVAKCDRLREGDIPGPSSNSNYEIVREEIGTRFDFDPRHFKNLKPLRRFGNGDDDD